MKLNKKLAASLIVASLASACTTNPYTGEQQAGKSATYGAAGLAAGALTGYLTGKDTKSTLIGAAVGGAAGGGYGYYRDVQEKKLREILNGTGVQVKKDGNNLKLIMPGNITFPSGQFDLKSSFFKTLNSVALILKEFDKSKIAVSGHTDSNGDASKNNILSQERAGAVAEYLASQGVDSSRISAFGAGSSQPIASNKSDAGKAQNRRVEINIIPNN